MSEKSPYKVMGAVNGWRIMNAQPARRKNPPRKLFSGIDKRSRMGHIWNQPINGFRKEEPNVKCRFCKKPRFLMESRRCNGDTGSR